MIDGFGIPSEVRLASHSARRGLMVDETRTCPETLSGKLVLVDVDSMAWILCLESRSTASSTELNLSWRSTSESGKSLCLN